ncbi:hypothetical protein OV208_30560 [Corallococcus sp. bb12-1]|uniref:hypothetical protein n=1 Tax=Corallococcus sp. bb12-1 TaxID=2996784 RepID=UPI0022713F8B|nr:hypothetical protein [Corallococcus sp. bb12-1]MCY1045695.1 hypothetical protein [Corallococcus sp. bb12-1]
MELHHGRLFDHVHLQVRDLEASKRFYKAVLEVMGIAVFSESERQQHRDGVPRSGEALGAIGRPPMGLKAHPLKQRVGG